MRVALVREMMVGSATFVQGVSFKLFRHNPKTILGVVMSGAAPKGFSGYADIMNLQFSDI
jgi:hypothetical protein